MTRLARFALTSFVVFITASAAQAQNWPQFRGSRSRRRGGRSEAPGHLERDGEHRLEDSTFPAEAGARRSCGAITCSS